ncbi:MAG: magnesium protoporphyrin IX methyltransferase [Gemmatimonadales bacterium]|nr:magnesium protoporphyrin IX methyltransferase [Gemmatimonadales bacterium]
MTASLDRPPAAAPTYTARRAWIEHYFDRHAAEAWARLTSDAPVSGVRRTVREGRDRMRRLLASWLPADLAGRRVLDAGCGTGLLAVDLARRGAEVVAIDLSKTLTDLARERLPADLGPGRVTFLAGDMLDPALGEFDFVVAMDSVIHYEVPDAVRVLEALAPRVRGSVCFTFAPGSPLLRAMRLMGRLFPRGDRSPSIVPVAEAVLRDALLAAPALVPFRVGRTQVVRRGFYTSQAMELVR